MVEEIEENDDDNVHCISGANEVVSDGINANTTIQVTYFNMIGDLYKYD